MKKLTALILSVLTIFCVSLFMIGCAEKQFTVKFVDYNGQVLVTQTVKEGEKPTYDLPDPVRDSDGVYRYVFKGWDKAIKPASKNVTYTAEYESIKIYSVIFKNWDGTILCQAWVDENALPIFAGETPTKPKEGSKVYTFSGWDKESIPVTEATELFAQFDWEYGDAELQGGDMIIKDREWITGGAL